MLRSMQELEDYAIGATDGAVGHVKDCLFDDEAWVIRYLVVATGNWLSRRKVLISPIAIREPNWAQRLLPVAITMQQVKDSPDIDTDKPVSRQYEMQYLDYYGYPSYWGGTGIWGDGMYPYSMSPGFDAYGLTRVHREGQARAYARADTARHRHDDPHLRSCHAVTGYHILALDSEIGHVESMLVDEQTWAIRYLVVNTRNWWIGHKVLIAPEWVTGVQWTDQTVHLDLTRSAIQGAPPYDEAVELNREHEANLYAHYARPEYWSDAPRRARLD